MKKLILVFAFLILAGGLLPTLAKDVPSESPAPQQVVDTGIHKDRNDEMTRLGIFLGSGLFVTFLVIVANRARKEGHFED